MIRLQLGALAAALCMPFAIGQSGAAGSRSLPMQFEVRQEGPVEACGAQCRTWVSALGSITAETPHDFSDFARRHDLRGGLLVLDSGGGSVHGAMALGRHIRKLGMTTTVGKTLTVAAERGSPRPRAKLSPHADCESMCVFVLLAGEKRFVPQGARLMVHQIWLGDRRDDAAAATYSAEDLVLVQRDIGRLAQYTVEMGGSIDFLELSLRIPPWEPMRSLTRDEIRNMHVEAGPQTTPPTVATPNVASASSFMVAGGRRKNAGPRGWIVSERAGQIALVRNHPLTVEGEEIGRFELTLACGEAPGSLDAAYSERRLAAGTTNPLKAVTLSLSSRAEPLQVVSSEPVSRSLEMSTKARGSVPVSFVRLFSEVHNRPLVVETVSTDDSRTTIRVGSSGASTALTRLLDSCGSRAVHAANARTGQGSAR